MARRSRMSAMKSHLPTRQMMAVHTAHQMMRWQMTSSESTCPSSFQYSGKSPHSR